MSIIFKCKINNEKSFFEDEMFHLLSYLKLPAFFQVK